MIYLVLFLLFIVSIFPTFNKLSFREYIFPSIAIISIFVLGIKTWESESVLVGVVALSIYSLFGYEKITTSAATLGLISLLSIHFGFSFTTSIIMTLIFTSIDIIAAKRLKHLIAISIAICAIVFNSFIFVALFVVYILFFFNDDDLTWAVFQMLLLSLNRGIFYNFQYSEILIPLFVILAIVLFNNKKNSNLQIFTISYFILLSLNEYNGVQLLCLIYFLTEALLSLIKIEVTRIGNKKYSIENISSSLISTINPCTFISIALISNRPGSLFLLILVLLLINLKSVKEFNIKEYGFYVNCLINFVILCLIVQPYSGGFYTLGFSDKFGVSFHVVSLYLPILIQLTFLLLGVAWNYFKIEKSNFATLLERYELINSYRHNYLISNCESSLNNKIEYTRTEPREFPRSRMPFGDAWTLISFFLVLFITIKLVVNI